MSASLDDVAAKVAALMAEKGQVADHWKGIEGGLAAELQSYITAHTNEARKASELMSQVTPKVMAVQLNPAQAVLAARSSLQKAKAWLKANWRPVVYVGIAAILLFDLFKG